MEHVEARAVGFGQLYGALRSQQAGTAGADVGVARY